MKRKKEKKWERKWEQSEVERLDGEILALCIRRIRLDHHGQRHKFIWSLIKGLFQALRKHAARTNDLELQWRLYDWLDRRRGKLGQELGIFKKPKNSPFRQLHKQLPLL